MSGMKMFRSLKRQRYKIFGLIIVSLLLIRVGLIWFFPEGKGHYEIRTGLTGLVRKPFEQIIQCIIEAGKPILAVVLLELRLPIGL